MVIFSIACAGKVPDISNVLFPFMRDGNFGIPLTVGNGKIIDVDRMCKDRAHQSPLL